MVLPIISQNKISWMHFPQTDVFPNFSCLTRYQVTMFFSGYGRRSKVTILEVPQASWYSRNRSIHILLFVPKTVFCAQRSQRISYSYEKLIFSSDCNSKIIHGKISVCTKMYFYQRQIYIYSNILLEISYKPYYWKPKTSKH